MAVVARKTTCNVTRQEFSDKAQDLEIMLGDKPLKAKVHLFSTGSLGWNANGRITLKVGDKDVVVQIGLNLTLVGSKELPLS